MRWYELNISGSGTFRSGTVTDPSTYHFNAAISPDRAVTSTTQQFGDSMVMGYTSSSPTLFPQVRMVSKAGAAPQSPEVPVKSSGTFYRGPDCVAGLCRWGEYAGATPDPLPASGPSRVWLVNQFAFSPGPRQAAGSPGTGSRCPEPARLQAATAALALATSLAVLSLGGVAGASHNLTRHLSLGEPKTDGAVGSIWVGASADGSRVFFCTPRPARLGRHRRLLRHLRARGRHDDARLRGRDQRQRRLRRRVRAAPQRRLAGLLPTAEQLVTADTDSSQDLYERSGGTTTQVSAGEINGNGAFDAGFVGASGDGSRVFFETDEQLASGDTDAAATSTSAPAARRPRSRPGQINGNGAFDATFADASDDGSRVFFQTDEQLVAADTDSAQRHLRARRRRRRRRSRPARSTATAPSTPTSPGALGRRHAGLLHDRRAAGRRRHRQLAATSTSAPAARRPRSRPARSTATAPSTPSSRGASADGTRVFFDDRRAAGGRRHRRSHGRLRARRAARRRWSRPAQINGNGAFARRTRAARRHLERRLAGLLRRPTSSSSPPTPTPLVDVYERSGGTTTQVTGGAQSTATAPIDAFVQGTRATARGSSSRPPEQLVAADTDSSERHLRALRRRDDAGLGRPDRAATAPSSRDFGGASSDGTRVFFNTSEQLVAADTDGAFDVYERSGGATTLVSVGEPTGNGAFAAIFRGASGDGTRVFFETAEQLVAADTDAVDGHLPALRRAARPGSRAAR